MGGPERQIVFLVDEVDAFIARKHVTRGGVKLLSSLVDKVDAFNAFRSMPFGSIKEASPL
jgi:hypothetical protein